MVRTLWPGRRAADTFIFKDNIAAGLTGGINNFVEDLCQAQHDVIEFIGVAGVTSFADFTFDTRTVPGSGPCTIIHAGADQVTLVGFTGTTAHDSCLLEKRAAWRAILMSSLAHCRPVRVSCHVCTWHFETSDNVLSTVALGC